MEIHDSLQFMLKFSFYKKCQVFFLLFLFPNNNLLRLLASCTRLNQQQSHALLLPGTACLHSGLNLWLISHCCPSHSLHQSIFELLDSLNTGVFASMQPPTVRATSNTGSWRLGFLWEKTDTWKWCLCVYQCLWTFFWCFEL